VAYEIKKHDSVKERSTGDYGIIIDIQYVHDRYQLFGVSGWRYGIHNLEKQSFETLHKAINYQVKEIERVISELEQISFQHGKHYLDKRNTNREFNHGAEDGIDMAIEKLKEVLSHSSDHPNRGNTAEPEHHS